MEFCGHKRRTDEAWEFIIACERFSIDISIDRLETVLCQTHLVVAEPVPFPFLLARITLDSLVSLTHLERNITIVVGFAMKASKETDWIICVSRNWIDSFRVEHIRHFEAEGALEKVQVEQDQVSFVSSTFSSGKESPKVSLMISRSS